MTPIDRIKKRRLELGISYAKLEELSGISRSTLQRYEKSDFDIRLDKLSAIATALGVTPSYLMGYESKDIPLNEYRPIIPILDEIGYSIEYDDNNEKLMILNKEGINADIAADDIKTLKSSIIDYASFCVNKLLEK